MRLFASLALLACSATVLQACSPSAITTKLFVSPQTLAAGALNQAQAAAHVQYLLDLNVSDYRKDDATSFGCVDGRADDPMIGTPGGDLAEFAGGVAVYYNITGKTPDKAGIQALFQSFVSKYVSASRPFYFHTDDTKLNMALASISAAVGRTITSFPVNAPPASETTAWMNELTASYAQGCGHIRLMIANFSLYGLTSPFVPQTVIQVFYEEMWKASAADKAKYNFQVKLGPLIGKAIGIVSNAGPSCTGYSPAVLPSNLGSSIFVYHASAVDTFRKNILTPFFVGQQGSNLNNNTFYNALTSLQTTQLTSTLTYLSPANAISLFTMDVNTTGSALNTGTCPDTGKKAALSVAPAFIQAMFTLFSMSLAKVYMN